MGENIHNFGGVSRVWDVFGLRHPVPSGFPYDQIFPGPTPLPIAYEFLTSRKVNFVSMNVKMDPDDREAGFMDNPFWRDNFPTGCFA